MRPSRPSEHGAFLTERRHALKAVLAEIIPEAARFVWEVGSGHGHFLAAYAKANPRTPCVGVDIASDRIGRAERKRERGRLENLRFVRADAEDFVAAMPERACFTAVFILFPDPWPKRRHHKNRILHAGFLTAVAARSVEGAGLYFRTDHEPYFREVQAAVRLHGDWAESDPGAWPFEEQTVFEKRAAGHFSLVATRR